MADNELFFALIGTTARLTRRLDQSLSSIKGISFSEYQLLAAIQAQADTAATRVNLAESVGLTPSGVTRALKPLEKLGFVETIRDARDARKSLAALTPAGVELISDAMGVVNDSLEKLGGVDMLTETEHERFIRFLHELANA